MGAGDDATVASHLGREESQREPRITARASDERPPVDSCSTEERGEMTRREAVSLQNGTSDPSSSRSGTSSIRSTGDPPEGSSEGRDPRARPARRFYTILLAGVANIIGDRVLCPLAEAASLAAMPSAITAAAIATVGAQYLGLAFSAWSLVRKRRWPATRGVWAPSTFEGSKFLAFGGPVSQLLCWRIAVYAYVGRCASPATAASERATTR